jgi:hypothetical protein
MHYLLGWEEEGPPLGGLALVFHPMDISSMDWLPFILCLSASSSLASLRDFLPSFLDGLSKVSSSDEPDISRGFFLIMFAYVGEEEPSTWVIVGVGGFFSLFPSITGRGAC